MEILLCLLDHGLGGNNPQCLAQEVTYCQSCNNDSQHLGDTAPVQHFAWITLLYLPTTMRDRSYHWLPYSSQRLHEVPGTMYHRFTGEGIEAPMSLTC